MLCNWTANGVYSTHGSWRGLPLVSAHLKSPAALILFLSIKYTRGLCCHPEEPQQDGELGWQDPQEAQRREMQRTVCWKEQPQASAHAGCHSAGKQLWRKGPGSSGGHQVWHEPLMGHCWKKSKRLMIPWDIIPSGQGEWFFPSAQHCWSHISSTGSSLDSPGTRETWKHWKESNKGLPWWWKDWGISPVRKGWGSCTC